MFFSNIVMYFIILSTAATLFKAGQHDINTAADAAQALRPLAGNAAELLFAIGVIGVGFLAVPVMTIGAAYDLCQSFGWRHGLHVKPAEAKKFYVAIVVFTLLAMGLNFFGINPMKALVFAGIVQGFSTPVPDAGADADHQQQQNHGPMEEHLGDERAGMADDAGDVCGGDWAGYYLGEVDGGLRVAG